jgi:PTS system ascorbate-specific IIB component
MGAWKTMKIVTVCGMGFGTSLMVKMSIDDILKELGKQADTQAMDMGSVKGLEADLFVTSKEMESTFPEVDAPVIYLDNMTNKAEIKEKVIPFLNR